MAITMHLPSSPLNAYIERMWYWEGAAPYPLMVVFPTPSLQLMVNFGAAYSVYGSGVDGGDQCATCAESWAIGVRNTSNVMEWPRDVRIVTVSFKAGGAYPFLRLPLAELRNQIVSLDAIWGSAAVEIRERLAEAPTPQARFALLERILLARLARLGAEARGLDRGVEAGLALTQRAVAEIARRRGALSIGALSEEIGVSHKHLITQFQRLVGGAPKALARIYRVQRALDSLDPARPLMWAQVAQHAGYYDEAHFSKDVRAFTGHTPSECLALVRRVRIEHPEFALSPTFLPAR
jgi:AraC-like DNA-binding protein